MNGFLDLGVGRGGDEEERVRMWSGQKTENDKETKRKGKCVVKERGFDPAADV